MVEAVFSAARATPQELARFRVDVAALQEEMLRFPQIDLEDQTSHQFMNGLYIRTLKVRAGELFVGRQYRHGNTFMLLQGEGVFFSPLGSARLKAPQIFVDGPGTKRAGLALTDGLIVNISNISELGDCTDLATVEAYLYEPDPTSPYTTGNKLKCQV